VVAHGVGAGNRAALALARRAGRVAHHAYYVTAVDSRGPSHPDAPAAPPGNRLVGHRSYDLSNLVEAAVRQAGGHPAAAPELPPIEYLGGHAVLRYATGEEAETYRRIMRVLYLEHQAFGLRLRPPQIADRLRERYALNLDPDLLDQRLGQLSQWNAVERDHDAGLATTAAEWRRNRYTYDVTPAGRLTEDLLAQLDALGEEIGRLDAARLPAIRDALAKLAGELDQEEPDGTRLRQIFERVLAEVEALHVGALALMRSLGQLMRTAEELSEDEFEHGKGALLEHLQGFRQSRRQHTPALLDLLDRVGSRPERLVVRIVAGEQFVALPGTASVATQQARRTAELLERWLGLRAWFVGDDAGNSPWRTLNDQVIDAIRTVLAIAERLIERQSARVDRAAVFVALATRAAQAPPGEATAWVRGALGIRTPRHVGVPEEDPEQVGDRGRTSWFSAPSAPVVARLRTPGQAAPRGRGAPIADLGEGRRRLAKRRVAEREELRMLGDPLVNARSETAPRPGRLRQNHEPDGAAEPARRAHRRRIRRRGATRRVSRRCRRSSPGRPARVHRGCRSQSRRG
jgi:uncharacterized protein (TIGR02677 family)